MRFITKIKPLLLIIFFVFLMVPVFILLGKNINQNGTPKPSPTPQASLISPTILIPRDVPPARILNVIRTAPPENPSITYSYIQPIEITFNNEVRAADLRYAVSPSTEIGLKNGKHPNVVIISPLTKWIDGKTTITIAPGSFAKDGSVLYQPFTYEINTLRPTDPPEVN